MPFEYLEFSRAFGGKPCPRAPAPVLVHGSGLKNRATRAQVVGIPKPDPSGSHERGSKDPTRSISASKSWRFTSSDRNRSERFHLSESVVTVLIEPSQYSPHSGFPGALLSTISKHTEKDQNLKKKSRSSECLSESVPS